MSIVTTTLYDCYDNIIGLSKTECECDDPKGDFTLSYNTSLSGLFLDELSPLTMIRGLESCENGDLWEIMDNARERGIKEFVRDGFQELMKHRKLRQNKWSGGIGKRRATLDRTITETYAGVHFFCKSMKNGTITIDKIYTNFNFTGVVTLWVYNNKNELLGTYALNAVEDTFTENDITDLELPMWDDFVDNLEYFFVYALGANAPRDNQLGCNTCASGRPQFAPNRPYFYKTHTEKNGWANYVMIGGFETNTLEFEELRHGGSGYMNGLSFDAEFKCNAHEIFCMEEMDFEADPLAISIASAIRLKAAYFLGEDILASNLNYWTIIKREFLIVQMNKWEEKYKETIEYIAKKLPMTKTDCWMCDDDNRLSRETIYA